MLVTTFGRSFINCNAKRNASSAFATYAIAAACKRHPDAYIKCSKNTIRVLVPSAKNCCSVLIELNVAS